MSDSASNRLYNNEVADFSEAMKLVRQQCEWEIQHSAPEESVEEFQAFARTADACAAEYAAETDHDAMFKRWIDSYNADRRDIGDCAMMGDYSMLAI